MAGEPSAARAGDGRNPHGYTRKLDLMKQDRTERDHCRHPADSAKEKVERYFPGPDRRFYHRLSVVAGLPRNWATDDIDTATRDNTFLPRLLAQLLEALFRSRIGCHEKNANPTSVAMMDAIAVANAEVHADFK